MERGFKSSYMPKEHFEKEYKTSDETSDLKYASEFGAPEELQKSEEGLANYVKKHKMKY